MKALEILKNPSFVIPANGNHIYKQGSIEEAIAELEALQAHKTCDECNKKLFCEMAQKSKDTFGTKLNEQWFICYEPKE